MLSFCCIILASVSPELHSFVFFLSVAFINHEESTENRAESRRQAELILRRDQEEVNTTPMPLRVLPMLETKIPQKFSNGPTSTPQVLVQLFRGKVAFIYLFIVLLSTVFAAIHKYCVRYLNFQERKACWTFMPSGWIRTTKPS